MKNVVFWDIITPGRTSQETHYVSTTESSRLMLCKIWGFHGGNYEEWRLLGYKNPVRTSQETHYVSTTEFSRLILCKVWGFHGGDYGEFRLLGCDAVWRILTRDTRLHTLRHSSSSEEIPLDISNKYFILDSEWGRELYRQMLQVKLRTEISTV
jgi:hypothetical protein